MEQEKFKVLLYLKKSTPDKLGKTPIMGRVTVGRSMVQFSCKLSCTPDLWNPRESRLNGKSREAVVTNAKLDKLLLSVNEAYAASMERKRPFTAEDVKNLFQGSVDTQMTLLRRLDLLIDDLKSRVGVDVAVGTIPAYHYTRKALSELIKKKFNTSDIAFGQLSEQFIRDFQDYTLSEKGLAMETVRHYLAILKKSASWLSRRDIPKSSILPITNSPNRKKPPPKLSAVKTLKRYGMLKYLPDDRHSPLHEICFFSPVIPERLMPIRSPSPVRTCLPMTTENCG